jgi:hypothetical protein
VKVQEIFGTKTVGYVEQEARRSKTKWLVAGAMRAALKSAAFH